MSEAAKRTSGRGRFDCEVCGRDTLLVGAFDYLIFANIDKLAKRLNPAGLVISEVVFGILLTAVAVQLAVIGLVLLGIVTATPH